MQTQILTPVPDVSFDHVRPDEVLVCEDVLPVNLRRLAAATITQAIRELTGRDLVRAIDAALWLTDNDAPWWFEACDMPFADGLQLLVSGSAGRLNARFRRLE